MDGLVTLRESAVVAAIEEVDSRAQGEAPPVGGGERDYQEHSGGHAQDRDDGEAEGARVLHKKRGGAKRTSPFASGRIGSRFLSPRHGLHFGFATGHVGRGGLAGEDAVVLAVKEID